MRLFDSAQAHTPNAVSIRPRRYRGETSRVGVFPYVVKGKLIWQYRPEDEVLEPKSVDSMLDAVMTIGHPRDDTELAVIHGSIYDVEIDQDQMVINSDFLLVTEEADTLAKSGSPLSPMYDADVIDMPGVYNGQHYDVIQKNIRYTSVGFVDRARQGDSIRVFYQLSRDSGTAVTASGIEYNASLIGINGIDMKRKLSDSVDVLTTSVPAPAIGVVTEAVVVTATTLEELETVVAVEAAVEPVVAVEAAVEPVVAVEVAVEPVATVEEIDDEAIENINVIAQITDEGGVLVNRDFVNEVVAVAELAVETGVMTLADAIYHGQANLAAVQTMILADAGIVLLTSDNVGTAFRVFNAQRVAQKQAETAIDKALSTTVKAEPARQRQTIGDQYQTQIKQKTVAAPGIPGKQRQNPIVPVVTHPTTTRTTVADSADRPSEYVSFDSIGL